MKNNKLTFFSNSNTLYVYAHNFSSFDGIFLLKHLIIKIIKNIKLKK